MSSPGAASVHAVLGGALRDPRRIAHWATHPEELAALGIAPGSLDLRVLRQFAGLALKVRHNGLRGPWRASFLLLGEAGLEADLFGDYALAIAASGGRLGADDLSRGDALLNFIGAWGRPEDCGHALLWDLVRHEHALFTLAATDLADDTTQTASLALNQMLRVRGRVQLHEFQHDPQAAAAALARRRPDWRTLPTAPRLQAYWRAPGAETVHLMQLDAFAFALLQALSVPATPSVVFTRIGVARHRHSAALRLLAPLREAGLFAQAEPTR